MSVPYKQNPLVNFALDVGGALWVCAKAVMLASAATAVAGFVILPTTYYAQKNREAYNALLSDIDHRDSNSFTSVATCTTRGFFRKTCEKSHDTAFFWGNFPSTSVVYNSLPECTNIHGDNCGEVGSLPIAYMPTVVGWQAAATDMAKAVPIYATRDPKTGMRRDGKLITLDTAIPKS